MEEVKLTKREKVKRHFKKHKGKYVTGGVCLVVGGGIGVLGYKLYSDRKFDELKESVDILTSKIGDCQGGTITIGESATIGDNNVIDASVKIFKNVTRRGHAGYPVECIEDPTIEFGSINEAAKNLGIAESTFRKRLKAGLPIGDNHYRIKGSWNVDEQILDSQQKHSI